MEGQAEDGDQEFRFICVKCAISSASNEDSKKTAPFMTMDFREKIQKSQLHLHLTHVLVNAIRKMNFQHVVSIK